MYNRYKGRRFEGGTRKINVKSLRLMSYLVREKQTPFVRMRIRQLIQDPKTDVNFSDSSGHTPLLIAISKRNKEAIRFLLGRSDCDVNEDYSSKLWMNSDVSFRYARQGRQDLHRSLKAKRIGQDCIAIVGCGGGTPLIWAIKYGDLDIIQMLLSHQYIDVNATDIRGNTAILFASRQLGESKAQHEKEIIQCLLKVEDIRIDIANNKGETLLGTLVKKSEYDLALHISRREDVDDNALTNAFNEQLLKEIHLYRRWDFNDCKNIFRRLLSFVNSHDINLVRAVNSGILLACEAQNIPLLEFLLMYKSDDLERLSSTVISALKRAIEYADFEVARCLLSCDYVNASVFEDIVIEGIVSSCTRGKFNVVEFLLTYEGLDVERQLGAIREGLTVAQQDVRLDIVNFVLTSEKFNAIDVRELESDVGLVLVDQCRRGNLSAARRLLACEGVNVNSQDQHGNTALHYLVRCSNAISVMKQILEMGASPAISNKQDMNPILLAAKFTKPEYVELLKNPEIHIQKRNEASLRCSATTFSAKSKGDMPAAGTGYSKTTPFGKY